MTRLVAGLERDGLVMRNVFAEVPARVEYTLTEPAQGLLPIMEEMGKWLQVQHDRLAQRPRGPWPGEHELQVRRFSTR